MIGPLDENGNVLQEGDMVCVVDGSTHLYGLVASIKEGGLIAPASAPVARDRSLKGFEMPNVVQIVFFPISRQFPDLQNASGRLTNVIKCVKPSHFAEFEKQMKRTQ